MVTRVAKRRPSTRSICLPGDKANFRTLQICLPVDKLCLTVDKACRCVRCSWFMMLEVSSGDSTTVRSNVIKKCVRCNTTGVRCWIQGNLSCSSFRASRARNCVSKEQQVKNSKHSSEVLYSLYSVLSIPQTSWARLRVKAKNMQYSAL